MRISDWSSDVCSSDLSLLRTSAGACTGRWTGSSQEPIASSPSSTTAGEAATRPPGCGTSTRRARRDRSARASDGLGGEVLQEDGVERFGVLGGPVPDAGQDLVAVRRSEETTSELQYLMRIWYDVVCLTRNN